MVKRILHTHGYPPAKQEQATQPVLEQAQLLALATSPDPLAVLFLRLTRLYTPRTAG